jgi:TRAP-type C4-dicarboxylate transport system permease small subunit
MQLATLARLILRDIPRAAIGAIILIAIAINFVNIVGRYVFLTPLPWAEEVLSFLVIWGVFLGAIAACYDNRHLVMDLFIGAFPAPLRRAIEGLILACHVVFCLYACVQAWTIVAVMARLGKVSITAGIPMTIPYMAFVVGFGLMALAAFVGALLRWRALARTDTQV